MVFAKEKLHWRASRCYALALEKGLGRVRVHSSGRTRKIGIEVQVMPDQIPDLPGETRGNREPKTFTGKTVCSRC